MVVPLKAKLMLLAAGVYLISPLDFIPDLFPGIGFVDDVLIAPTLAFLALKSILQATATSRKNPPLARR